MKYILRWPSIWLSKFLFRCSGFTLVLRETQFHEYEFYITGNQTITCGELAQFRCPANKRDVIKEGIHYGGAINIYVANGTGYDEAPYHVGNQADAFSALYTLPKLIEKQCIDYYDPELCPNHQYTRAQEYDEYDWNFYTKETMENIVCQTEEMIPQIRSLSMTEQGAILLWTPERWNESELQRRITEELDYTERFLRRLKAMIAYTPEYKYIVIQGP